MAIEYIGGSGGPSAADLLPKPATPSPVTTQAATQPTNTPTQATQATLPNQGGTGQVNSGLDPSVVALMHGLKTAEGAVGNYTAVGDGGTAAGAGQWSNQFNGKVQPLAAGEIPNNFKGEAQKYGLDPNDFSPENQNKVLYAEISAGKAAGLTPEQILSAHNSGDPNKYLSSSAQGTGQVGAYDVAGYVQRAMTAAQQYAQQNQSGSVLSPLQPSGPTNAITGDTSSPSIGGFTGNVVKSGANFAGNILNAAIHPLQTIQGIGSVAAGGLQELGGQTNDNTAAFDNLKTSLGQRYGSPQALLHTAYTDPVGLAADISTILGGVGGAVGAAGKVGELSDIGETSILAKGAAAAAKAKTGADFVVSPSGTAASTAEPILNGVQQTGGILNKASVLTNPLTPVLSGVGAVASKGAGPISTIVGKGIGVSGETVRALVDGSLPVEDMGTVTRASIAQDIKTALDEKEAALSETGGSYNSYRETPSPIQTAPDYLDNAFREGAGVEVKDGVITPTSGSLVRNAADISKLQQIYNLYKSDFLNGTMDSNKFLNLRSDLAEKANFGNGLTKNLERAAAGIRDDLNKTYRKQVPGLDAKDELYSQQKPEFDRLKKGFLNKEGDLLDTATNKIANAGGAGKDQLLSRLEEIQPGIAQRLAALKSFEEIEKAFQGKGSGITGAIIRAGETGGLATGITSGNIPVIAASLGTAIITSPHLVIPILKLIGNNKELLKAVLTHVAKYATMGSAAHAALNGASSSSQEETTQSPAPTNQAQAATGSNNTNQGDQPQVQSSSKNPSDLTSLASSKGFDLDAARKAGYSDKEITDFLNTP